MREGIPIIEIAIEEINKDKVHLKLRGVVDKHITRLESKKSGTLDDRVRIKSWSREIVLSFAYYCIVICVNWGVNYEGICYIVKGKEDWIILIHRVCCVEISWADRATLITIETNRPIWRRAGCLYEREPLTVLIGGVCWNLIPYISGDIITPEYHSLSNVLTCHYIVPVCSPCPVWGWRI